MEIAHTNNIALTPKKIPDCGIGNSLGYTDNFMDALSILEEKISEVGYWSTNGYDFNESKAVRDDKFVGLAIDENNQSELTEKRVKDWVFQLKKGLEL